MESVLRAKNYTWRGNHTSFKHQGGEQRQCLTFRSMYYGVKAVRQILFQGTEALRKKFLTFQNLKVSINKNWWVSLWLR